MAPQKKKQENKLPFISVCTPTFNRRPFIENMFECFRNQTYPKNRIEWIIVDDGTDKIRDLIEGSNIPQIRYFEVNEKMTLGAKRNYMHRFVRGTIIVYMDDDDYYPPERIEDAVDKLQANPQAMAAGSSEIYIYFKHIQKMYKCGPYNPNHATAGTFAFRTDLLKITKYEEHAAVAEERAFLKDYTIPFVQLDPMKSILVFSHNHNTFDKRKMLDNPHPDFFRECDKTVDMFIRNPSEKNIFDFFMRDIDGLLENYEPGDPKMKPDVLKQIKEIEEKRDQMVKEEMAKMQSNGQIMLQQPGQPPTVLSNQQIVELIQQQQQHIQQLSQKCEESNNAIMMLQKQLVEKTRTIREISNGQRSEDVGDSSDSNASIIRLEDMIVTLQKQLIEKTKVIRQLEKNVVVPAEPENISESQNVITMLQKQLIEKTKTIRELSKTAPVNQNNSVGSQSMITILQTQLVEKNNTIRSLNQKIGSDEDAALNKIHDLELLVNMLQKNLIDKNREIQLLQSNRTLSSPPSSFTRIPIQTDDNDSLAMKSKSDPEITVSAED
jgi:glycosyltransferase involved in cell wall biosynthesis